MKKVCIVSHETPREGGGFRRYTAGKEYEVEGESPYFVKALPEENPLPPDPSPLTDSKEEE